MKYTKKPKKRGKNTPSEKVKKAFSNPKVSQRKQQD